MALIWQKIKGMAKFLHSWFCTKEVRPDSECSDHQTGRTSTPTQEALQQLKDEEQLLKGFERMQNSLLRCVKKQHKIYKAEQPPDIAPDDSQQRMRGGGVMFGGKGWK